MHAVASALERAGTQGGPGILTEADALTWVAMIQNEQLEHGEFPAYRVTQRVRVGYLVCPLVSTYVHDALACIDSGSPSFEPLCMDLFRGRERARVLRTVGEIRRSIRGFLAWQEDGHGGLRRYGRASPLAADLDTTALAGIAFSEAVSGARAAQVRRIGLIERLLSTTPEPPVLSLVSALRCAVRLGSDTARIRSALESHLAHLDFETLEPSAGHAVPETVVYALGRLFREEPDALGAGAWEHARRAARAASAREDVPALSAAFILSALVDFGESSRVLVSAEQHLLDSRAAAGGWPFQALLSDESGSPALTTALALSALLRARPLLVRP